jgi:hypothetical protein
MPTEGVMFICPPASRKKLPLRAVLAVGFGNTVVTRDGESIWSEMQWRNRNRRLRSIEYRARLDPDRDWRVFFDGPLVGEEYQRQGKNNWVLIKRTDGFA